MVIIDFFCYATKQLYFEVHYQQHITILFYITPTGNISNMSYLNLKQNKAQIHNETKFSIRNILCACDTLKLFTPIVYQAIINITQILL